MLRILSAFLISSAASFFPASVALALDGPSGPGEERTQPPSPTDRLAGSLATELVKACQLADPDDLPAFELCRPQAQPEQPQLQQQPQAPERPQMQQQAQQRQDAADQETVGQGIWPKDE